MRRAGSIESDPVTRIRANDLSRWRLLIVVLAVLLFASAASAQTNVYTIRGTAGGNNDIWSINLSTGVETLVLAGYPGGNAASLAQRPSDGMLFYSINGTNGAVYRFNPATPNVAPVAIGNLGAGVSGGFRMAFSGNTLYYMIGNVGTDDDTVYTINQNTGAATVVATVTNTNNGGDIAFLGNTLYIIDQDLRLCTYSNLPASGAAGNCNTININGANSIGIAFTAGGQLLLQTVNPSNLYSITLPGLGVSSIAALSGGNTATGDMASAAVPPPSLSITKTDGVTTVYRGGPVTYTIVVSNGSAYPVTGTVTDTVPAGVTGVTWTCAASAGSTCTNASGAGNNINTSATLAVSGTATYTVSGTVSAAASGTLTNTANVAVPAWLTDANPANNTASDIDTINLNANLSITKTDGLANINPGSAVTYTIVVSNAGPDASNGSIVTDTVPATITGVTWTCGSPTGGATCGVASGSGNISTTANLPSGGSVRYTVSGTLAATATGTLSNTASVVTPASGVTDPSDPTRIGAGNNSATDNTLINPVSDLQIAKTHAGNFTQGQSGATYSITATNSGLAATSGTVTVIDTLPAGLTASAISGTGWTCVLGTLTCTRADVLAAGPSYPVITVTVNVANNAAASVTNTATVSGGGEVNTANDTATNPTTIVQLPDLSINKNHVGNFTQGQVGVTYTITATNSGFAATSGTVTVTDTLPAGLTATAISGTGWTCVLGTLTCTRSDALAAGASYPLITLTVNVANNAAASVTNTASVSGGGQTNTVNDTANNPTIINQLPDLSITKSHSGNFTQGQAGATYTITATNSGFASTSGTVTVVDAIPSGLTATAISGPGWSCVLGTLTCTRNDALAAGASYPVITLTVNVSLTAPGSVTNSAAVSGGGENNASNNTANDLTTINAAAPPSISLLKSVSPGGTQIPGTDLLYTIVYTNTGGQPATTVIIVDPNPLNAAPLERVFHNVDFKIGSMASSPGTTGLVAIFEYSNDGGATWTYTPISGSGGAPAGYDRSVTNVRWRFTGSLSHLAPNNSGSVSFTVSIR